jgi:hypothetical protein
MMGSSSRSRSRSNQLAIRSCLGRTPIDHALVAVATPASRSEGLAFFMHWVKIELR